MQIGPDGGAVADLHLKLRESCASLASAGFLHLIAASLPSGPWATFGPTLLDWARHVAPRLRFRPSPTACPGPPGRVRGAHLLKLGCRPCFGRRRGAGRRHPHREALYRASCSHLCRPMRLTAPVCALVASTQGHTKEHPGSGVCATCGACHRVPPPGSLIAANTSRSMAFRASSSIGRTGCRWPRPLGKDRVERPFRVRRTAIPSSRTAPREQETHPSRPAARSPAQAATNRT